VQAQAAVVGSFRSGSINVLLATDVGSEGMDFQQCELVVAFDPPDNVTSYIQVRRIATDQQHLEPLQGKTTTYVKVLLVVAFDPPKDVASYTQVGRSSKS
jgi:hypothetical protein